MTVMKQKENAKMIADQFEANREAERVEGERTPSARNTDTSTSCCLMRLRSPTRVYCRQQGRGQRRGKGIRCAVVVSDVHLVDPFFPHVDTESRSVLVRVYSVRHHRIVGWSVSLLSLQ